jgi:hypothetical protein
VKPWFAGAKLRARSELRKTPAPSVPSSSVPPGIATIELTTTLLSVRSDQLAPESSEAQSPSVVPANNVSGRSGSWAKARVRRLLAGMPLNLAQEPPAFRER